jgi:hypothetical protein
VEHVACMGKMKYANTVAHFSVLHKQEVFTERVKYRFFKDIPARRRWLLLTPNKLACTSRKVSYQTADADGL